MALYQPGCLLHKVLALKAPRDLYNLAKKQVSFKQRTQNTMVTKDWTTNVGLVRLPKTAQKNNFAQKWKHSKEIVAYFKNKMHTALKK